MARYTRKAFKVPHTTLCSLEFLKPRDLSGNRHGKIQSNRANNFFHEYYFERPIFLLGFRGTNSAFDQQPEAIINWQRPENRKCPDVPPKRSLSTNPMPMIWDQIVKKGTLNDTC